MPLPLTVCCFSKIQIGFTFLVLAHSGSLAKGPLHGCVCACMHVCFCSSALAAVGWSLWIRFLLKKSLHLPSHCRPLLRWLATYLISVLATQQRKTPAITSLHCFMYVWSSILPAGLFSVSHCWSVNVGMPASDRSTSGAVLCWLDFSGSSSWFVITRTVVIVVGWHIDLLLLPFLIFFSPHVSKYTGII